MKFRLGVEIGILSAVMMLAAACGRTDAEPVKDTTENVAESVTEDAAEAELEELKREAADTDSEETEALVEISTGRNSQSAQALGNDEGGSGMAIGGDTATGDKITSEISSEKQTAAAEPETKETAAKETAAKETVAAVTKSKNGYSDGAGIGLNSVWQYADFSVINSGTATIYLAKSNRKDKIIGINAGHGTSGGTNVKTWCHPDKTAKVTGGTTSAGATQAVAVSTGMNFSDGTKESTVTLKEAQLIKNILLERGYDVLMIRDGDDVQLDNVARTVICNNVADCHIAIHWDGDGLDYDKGCFYMSVPDGIKYLDSVAAAWQSSEALGNSLIAGLKGRGCKIFGDGTMDMDLTQTSYSTVPSIDIELGNQSSDHSDATLETLALGIADGVESFFE